MRFGNFKEHIITPCEKMRGFLLFKYLVVLQTYEGRTESHEQYFFACELGTADDGECDSRWNQMLYYP